MSMLAGRLSRVFPTLAGFNSTGGAISGVFGCGGSTPHQGVGVRELQDGKRQHAKKQREENGGTAAVMEKTLLLSLWFGFGMRVKKNRAKQDAIPPIAPKKADGGGYWDASSCRNRS